MLIVFGSIAMTITMGVDTLPDINERITASDFSVTPGGKGANQALAAARAGAGKVAIIGKISDDEFSSHILTKIRRDGVMTSGVGQSDLPTATHVIVQDSRGRSMEIVNPGANVETTHEQVPDDILNEKALVLVQTELAEAENDELLARAKQGGTKTVMNLSPSIKMSKRMLKNIDYLIVNHDEAKKLAVQMGMKMEVNAMKIAEGLAQLGGLYCIITLGERGAVAVTPDRVG
ncbi:MAG TPA: PfkB family carbohydrate kinase, partial [Alphaproteobacteria bacterium]|nr:PfkB family carbohydrate kinase [Alphaproteobacteria bacterium]